jgi:hypothetical protein
MISKEKHLREVHDCVFDRHPLSFDDIIHARKEIMYGDEMIFFLGSIDGLI